MYAEQSDFTSESAKFVRSCWVELGVWDCNVSFGLVIGEGTLDLVSSPLHLISSHLIVSSLSCLLGLLVLSQSHLHFISFCFISSHFVSFCLTYIVALA